ncbi:MAG: glycosyltransferase family 2 protein, partial [Acidobacteriota bacterium]|nr:glycosyltransferase family 2 protein [Acidobacteriota bacterium]
MTRPQVTLIVVPRERFSYAARSLENIYENTEFPFNLIYVDGGSPPQVSRYLEETSRRRGFKLIRTEHYLSPNKARNLGLRHVETEYVVFIDNDVVVKPGWLAALVRCAEETGAWIVGPLYFIGELKRQVIHMAGGTISIREEQGKRFLYEDHRFAGKRLS